MKKQNRKLGRAMVRASEPTNTPVIEAAGTSEGVKKSWEKRNHAQIADEHYGNMLSNFDRNQYSGAAHETTARALQSDAAGDHRAAAVAHKAAAKAQGYDSEKGQEHKEGYDFHRGKVEEKLKSMGGVMNSHHLSGLKKDIKAEGTDELPASVQAKAVVHCKASGSPIAAKKTWEVDKPIDFMWMPGGVHTIHASYGRSEADLRPIELTVNCTEDCASSVQAAFESIRANSPRRPPFICVEHRAQERAGEPQAFMWKTDPEPAIYCRCLPSGLGANNVNAKIHTSFSPTFDTDAEYSKMVCTDCEKQPATCKCSGSGWCFPDGVRGSVSNPAKVTAPDVQSVGSLTNWNAFREMLPIAARENHRAGTERCVEAGGTSEGAKKGWEERAKLHDAAYHSSDKAFYATKGASEPDTARRINADAIHKEAGEAHQKAAKARRALAEDFPQGSRDREHHLQQAEDHERHASSHLSMSARFRAVAADAPPNTVHATESTATATQAETKPSVATILASKAVVKSEAEKVMAKLRQNRLGVTAPKQEASKETAQTILARMSQTARPAAQTNEGK